MKKVLLFLFLIGVSLFARTNKYINDLYYAIKYNNTKGISNAVEYLSWFDLNLNNIFLEQETDLGGILEPNYIDMTPLDYAIECRNIEAIDTLLKFGANIERVTEYVPKYRGSDLNVTPLMVAAQVGGGKIISFLLRKGAKVNAKNRYGKTALMYSCRDGGNGDAHISSTKALINAGADVNIKDNNGTTALMYASLLHQNSDGKELIDLLIKNKANVNAKDSDGMTALMYSCGEYNSFGYYDILNPDIVKSLIRAGANINEIDRNGNTALLYAIDTYKGAAVDFGEANNDDLLPTFEVIKLLINNGADLNIGSETLSSLRKECPKLYKFLIDAGAY